MNLFLAKLFSTIRWKVFRLVSRIFLGETFGEAMLGACVSYDIENDQIYNDLREHVLDRHKICGPEVVCYNYPEGCPSWFRESSAYGTKSAWLLKDVFVSPKHGAIWTPPNSGEGGRVLQESVTNLGIFYLLGVPMEGMLPAIRLEGTQPIVPLRSDIAYYHALMDDLPQVLHAMDYRPDSRILISRKHPRYIDGMLSFLDIDDSKIVQTDRPVRAETCVFVPKLSRLSFIRTCDLKRLRSALLERLPESPAVERVYISRRGTTLRAFSNEAELEAVLKTRGFEVVRFEDLGFSEQLQKIRSARLIVAPHGSGLANIIVAHEGTSVIEIMSENYI